MSLLQEYLLAHIFLRSVTDGIDRLLGTELSQMLASLAFGVALGCALFLPPPPRLRGPLGSTVRLLTAFIVVSFISWAVGAGINDTIRNSHVALVVTTRFLLYLSMFFLLSYVYANAKFVRSVQTLYASSLLLTGAVAGIQFLVGDVSAASEYEDFERVWGLSSHPVLLSVEVTLMLLVYELCRRKRGLKVRAFEVVLYAVVLATLVVASSKTGVVLVGVVVGIFTLLRKPAWTPVFLLVAAGFIVATPFERLFGELASIPDFIASGAYTEFDFHTAVTSFHWRLTHWYFLIQRGMEQPILGYGPGQVIAYNSLALDAHSQFLQVFFDQGLLGLSVYGLFWFSLPVTVWKAFPSNPQRLDAMQRDVRTLWTISFGVLTLAATFSYGFSLATLAYSHLIVSIFVVLSPMQEKAAESLFPAAALPPQEA